MSTYFVLISPPHDVNRESVIRRTETTLGLKEIKDGLVMVVSEQIDN